LDKKAQPVAAALQVEREKTNGEKRSTLRAWMGGFAALGSLERRLIANKD
jgi:hypothetical protein